MQNKLNKPQVKPLDNTIQKDSKGLWEITWPLVESVLRNAGIVPNKDQANKAEQNLKGQDFMNTLPDDAKKKESIPESEAELPKDSTLKPSGDLPSQGEMSPETFEKIVAVLYEAYKPRLKRILAEQGSTSPPEPAQELLKEYDEAVEKLVPSANILAVSSFTKFLSAYNELKTVDPTEWDFYITVAGISVGLMGLADKVTDESEYNRLTKILSTKIIKWDKRGELALGDLMARMVKYREEMMSLPPDEFTKMWASLISSWCFVNLKLEVPRNKPSSIMIELGMLLIVSFHDWWN